VVVCVTMTQSLHSTQGEYAERSGFAPLSEITGNASSTKQLDHRGSFMGSKNIGLPTREKREALKGFSKREVADQKFMAKNTGSSIREKRVERSEC
jgi:hypothetical protein